MGAEVVRQRLRAVELLAAFAKKKKKKESLRDERHAPSLCLSHAGIKGTDLRIERRRRLMHWVTNVPNASDV